MRCFARFDIIGPILKKREKKQCRRVTFSKVAGSMPTTLLKVTLLHGCFLRFLNSTNVTKSRSASHIEKA